MKREREEGSPPKRAAVVRLNVGGQHFDTTKDCIDGTYGGPLNTISQFKKLQKGIVDSCLESLVVKIEFKICVEFFVRTSLAHAPCKEIID